MKLYKMRIGYVEDNEDIDNWGSTNVVAQNLMEAIKKTKLKKGEYLVEAEVIAEVHVK